MAGVSLGLGYRGVDVPNYMRRGRRMQREDNCCKTTILYRRETIIMAKSRGSRYHYSPRHLEGEDLPAFLTGELTVTCLSDLSTLIYRVQVGV